MGLDGKVKREQVRKGKPDKIIIISDFTSPQELKSTVVRKKSVVEEQITDNRKRGIMGLGVALWCQYRVLRGSNVEA